jgi:hypothetical protein
MDTGSLRSLTLRGVRGELIVSGDNGSFSLSFMDGLIVLAATVLLLLPRERRLDNTAGPPPVLVSDVSDFIQEFPLAPDLFENEFDLLSPTVKGGGEEADVLDTSMLGFFI